MAEVIDLDRARTDIRAIADTDPDRVAKCHYTNVDYNDNVTPHCIVGHYLWNLGFSAEDLDDLGTTRIGRLSTAFLGHRDGVVKVLNTFEPEALRFLDSVQLSQDLGNSWSEAVDNAEDLYE